MTTKTARQASWKGGGWVRPTTRLAIYLRDDFTCVYCGISARAHPICLSLDHLDRSGGNAASNLATCCFRCNDRRNGSTLAAWLDRLGWEGRDLEAVRGRLARVALPLGAVRGNAPAPGTFAAAAHALHADPPPWLQLLRRRAFKVRQQTLLFGPEPPAEEPEEPPAENGPDLVEDDGVPF